MQAAQNKYSGGRNLKHIPSPSNSSDAWFIGNHVDGEFAPSARLAVMLSTVQGLPTRASADAHTWLRSKACQERCARHIIASPLTVFVRSHLAHQDSVVCAAVESMLSNYYPTTQDAQKHKRSRFRAHYQNKNLLDYAHSFVKSVEEAAV